VRLALDAGDGSDLPTVRVSAGISAADAPVVMDDLLHRADSALYRAKRAGRDRTVTFTQRDPRGACDDDRAAAAGASAYS
jgi:PleD family two-component response regulator